MPHYSQVMTGMSPARSLCIYVIMQTMHTAVQTTGVRRGGGGLQASRALGALGLGRSRDRAAPSLWEASHKQIGGDLGVGNTPPPPPPHRLPPLRARPVSRQRAGRSSSVIKQRPQTPCLSPMRALLAAGKDPVAAGRWPQAASGVMKPSCPCQRRAWH